VPNRWASPQRVIGLIDGRWTLAVLAELQDGGRRYQELDDALDSVSHKVLTDTLRRAERDGLVVRHLDPGRVETATLYQLTDLGRSLDDLSPLSNDGAIPTGPTSRRPADAGADVAICNSRRSFALEAGRRFKSLSPRDETRPTDSAASTSSELNDRL
jgi:DNA-binding HxlR family transcriptional regulator